MPGGQFRSGQVTAWTQPQPSRAATGCLGMQLIRELAFWLKLGPQHSTLLAQLSAGVGRWTGRVF